ncbi:MAG: hypothetical protein BWZ10_01709 [candidate division BRC1 bacterium ADurb.BinA364]|nr:MAG: hypothetical protein BWZ10_01709 [candidate division BRC1 bacterium ADurb.BinA364]
MQEMPQDPVGGSYKINPYGTPPEHSVYGKPDW